MFFKENTGGVPLFISLLEKIRMCYFSIEILNSIYILTSFADSLFTPTETWANSDIEDVKKGNL